MDVAVIPTTKSENKHMKTHKYLGLDVHQVDTQVAIAAEGRDGEVRLYGTVRSDLHAMERLFAKLGGPDVVLHVAYEAGPSGRDVLTLAFVEVDVAVEGRALGVMLDHLLAGRVKRISCARDDGCEISAIRVVEAPR